MMNQKIVKTILLMSLAVPLLVNASPVFADLNLAKKSHRLAIKINELSISEKVEFCKNKLNDASMYTEMAAKEFMSDSTYSAKVALKLAIRDLAYTAVEDCTQANNILVVKNEVTQIYDSINQ